MSRLCLEMVWGGGILWELPVHHMQSTRLPIVPHALERRVPSNHPYLNQVHNQAFPITVLNTAAQVDLLD